MRILFIGDVVGRTGRDAVAAWLPRLQAEYPIDMVVANGENAAGGLGATAQVLRELRNTGIHAFTMGNHVWRQKEFVGDFDRLEGVVRPANYPAGAPGVGGMVVTGPGGHRVGIINLLGRIFMEPLDCPFAAVDRELGRLTTQTSVILVDMHGEATSEKVAMGWYLDGRCSAVVGTHTHVPTADERVLPKGTAYITDVGMCGAFDSVIGVEPDEVIRKFVTGMPAPFKVAKARPGINTVLIDVDEKSGRARSIQRIARVSEGSRV